MSLEVVRLKEVVSAKGTTIYHLAQALVAQGIIRAPSAIYMIANGDRIPSLRLLDAICTELDCERADIFPIAPKVLA